MPKMPEGEKKEESAESLAEKKEQVLFITRLNIEANCNFMHLGKTETGRSKTYRKGTQRKIPETEGRR